MNGWQRAITPDFDGTLRWEADCTVCGERVTRPGHLTRGLVENILPRCPQHRNLDTYPIAED